MTPLSRPGPALSRRRVDSPSLPVKGPGVRSSQPLYSVLSVCSVAKRARRSQ